MEQRALGKSDLMVSVMGYGCGAVGGLMVRGDPADQERAVARALELGITYFDTAPSYGDGASERNLGRVLARLRPRIVLGTKFRLPAGTPAGGVEAAIAASLEASLRRLGREHVDLFQLHNPIAERGPEESGAALLPPALVTGSVLPALDRLRRQGKFDWFGFTAIGETAALLSVAAGAGVGGGAGAVQPAEPVGRPRRAARLPGAGLWPADAARARERDRHHRHPRAGRGRAQRHGLAPPDCARRRSRRSAPGPTMPPMCGAPRLSPPWRGRRGSTGRPLSLSVSPSRTRR